MTHTHAVDRETGPRCCKGGVSYEQRCSCGCVRTRCTCAQCYDDWGTHTGDWSMPICSACGYHHPQDESCTNKSQEEKRHSDLSTIDLDHDLGLRDLTSQFGEED